MRLREHHVRLQSERVTLRPMTEDDWDILLKWNSDSEVLYYAEGDDVDSYSLAQIQGMYREVSQTAFCFIGEVEGRPIGECWLQEMNLDRILTRYADLDCRRIDLMIGEKGLWGKGLGTDIIRTLTRFGFVRQGADLIFGGVADYNPRSLGAFRKAGYRIHSRIRQPPGGKAQYECDHVLTRERYFSV